MSRRLLVPLALLWPLSGCATVKAVSIAACGVSDPRLGLVVTDPPAVVAYFRSVGAEGRQIVAAAQAGEDAGSAATAWIADQLDLLDRMNKCVPRG